MFDANKECKVGVIVWKISNCFQRENGMLFQHIQKYWLLSSIDGVEMHGKISSEYHNSPEWVIDTSQDKKYQREIFFKSGY